MSERRSWDVQPKQRAAAPQPAPAPVRKAKMQAEPVIRSSAPVRVTRPVQNNGRTLKEKRKQKRRSAQYVFLAFIILLGAASLYGVWRPALRIQEITVLGPGAEQAKQIAGAELQGTYYYLVPRNSVFFLPEEKIRQLLIAQIPEASAVSVQRTSFSSLGIQTTPRAKSFIWCGTTIDTPSAEGCYEADNEGFIFAQGSGPISTTTASSTPRSAREEVRVFGATDPEYAEGTSSVRAHVLVPGNITDMLKFVDAVRELGAPVTSLAIRGDEADLWLGGPNRITYIIGQEKDAVALAASVLPTIKSGYSGIQYIDLRFPGKAYIKRYGE